MRRVDKQKLESLVCKLWQTRNGLVADPESALLFCRFGRLRGEIVDLLLTDFDRRLAYTRGEGLAV